MRLNLLNNLRLRLRVDFDNVTASPYLSALIRYLNPPSFHRCQAGMSAPLGSIPSLQPGVSPSCCVALAGVGRNDLSQTSTDQ